MKSLKRFSAIAAIAVLAALGATAAQAAPNYDINRDGVVDVKDLDRLRARLDAGGAGPNTTIKVAAGTPEDINSDGVVSIYDLVAFKDYVTSIGKASMMLDLNLNGAVDITDRNTLLGGLNGSYSFRFDVNVDGAMNTADWNVFVLYARGNFPRLLIDTTSDGVVNARDLDNIGQGIDAGTYNRLYDFDANGVVNLADWGYAVSICNSIDPAIVFDVATNVSGPTVIDTFDARQIADYINRGILNQFRGTRYDFNADGRVSLADWGAWVNFVNNTLRKPDLVYDVNFDGLVNSYDVTLIQNAINAGLYDVARDVNASGRVDVYDRDAVSARVGNAAAVSTAMASLSTQSTCTGGVDITAAQAAIGATRGSKAYSASYDADQDGMITANDIALLRTAAGSCQ